MATIGQTLSAARVAAGYTVADLSARTRIREPVLMGMEQEDFVPCGGDFYARGHIRGICRALGLDPAPLLAEYDREHATGAIPAFAQPWRHPAATTEGIRAAAAARAAERAPEGAREGGRAPSPTHRFGDDDSGDGARRWGHFERGRILGGTSGEEPQDAHGRRAPGPREAGDGNRGGHRIPDEGSAYGVPAHEGSGYGVSAHEGPVYGDPVHGGPMNGVPAHEGPVYGDPVHGGPMNGVPAHEGSGYGVSAHEESVYGNPVPSGPMNGVPVYGGRANGAPRGGRHARGAGARGHRPAPRPRVAGGRRRGEAVRRHWPWAVVCAIVLLAALIGVRTWQDWDAGNPLRAAFDSSTNDRTVDSSVQPGGADGAADAAPPAPAESTVELEAVSRTWIEVTGADGEDLYVGFLLEGERQEYVAEDDLDLWIGDAGAVTITVNGEELDPAGLPGEVKEVTVGADGLVR